MPNYRTFQVSDKYFWGFKTRIDLDVIISIDNITQIVRDRMIGILKENNFTVLHEMIEGKQGHSPIYYHIHDKTLDEIINSEPDEVIYVCNHTH